MSCAHQTVFSQILVLFDHVKALHDGRLKISVSFAAEAHAWTAHALVVKVHSEVSALLTLPMADRYILVYYKSAIDLKLYQQRLQ